MKFAFSLCSFGLKLDKAEKTKIVHNTLIKHTFKSKEIETSIIPTCIIEKDSIEEARRTIHKDVDNFFDTAQIIAERP